MTRRRFAASWLLAPIIAALVLTGCGSTDGVATTESTSSSEAPTAPPAETSVPIGAAQDVADDDVTTRITVENLTYAQGSKYGLPAAGELQQITVTLEGIQGTTNVNPLYFTARAADGTSYDAALGTVDGQLATGTVTSGDILKGIVAFDVTGPPIASIRYNGALGDELAKWVGQIAASAPSSSPLSATAPTASTGSARGDLGLASTMSVPSCDGTGIVVLFSATNPNTYAEEVAAQLITNPGAQYLRTDNACPSLRQATTDGNAIYAVYRIAGTTSAEVCAAVAASGGDSYGKWLDTTTDPSYIIPC
ncbi:DUF1942 domain-containing protein [Rhodococcus sp. 06-156-3C]|uniref:DUF1942 domain-containing protein n=1 Tax=Nocardiaceae TaxID=85025 RepID=UPI00068F7752|nr:MULTISPECIES: DUF1942 domain-containing protein [Rhodococcus]OZD12561.1 DUF1942 domain-containing protein [Rhodococcus sp. 06-156-4a]OZD18030.1 DUF1942 domain-containing protein [Rhodococcus sp. 06-156-3C]OZD20410.1 DUF1942 domain-containing protein [Rhodococcus sp. 06-156-4C]OZD29254.1 DUF1942 domain-containing protein [Rhodococcus sp. 06-156-3]OZD30526.1 DUF1942 domain-containing protein [Rhodococcus sp. 06-156-3b]